MEPEENATPPHVKLIATAAFGLEAIVSRELLALGYESKTYQPGRLLIDADASAICRLNIHLRSAERILLCLGQFEADDFGKLFDGTKSLPWERWIPADAASPVRGRSIKSQLSSVPACQRMVKKAVVDRLMEAHGVSELPETGNEYRVEVALLNNIATLSIDTTGDGLHKRGYRPISGKAPIRETLAAALVQLSFWKPDRPLIDPFCGTGTIPIEAALIGRNIAPGINRTFASEAWPSVPKELWESARTAAKAEELPELPVRILGLDLHEGALSLARRNAEAANVAEDIHFQCKPFSELTSKREYGCIITNPPYGQRMNTPHSDSLRDAESEEETKIAAESDSKNETEEKPPARSRRERGPQPRHAFQYLPPDVADLYRSFPFVLRRLPTWSHYVITSVSDFEKIIGQRANRRRKVYNGRIECQYYQFHGPRPPRPGEKREPRPEQESGLSEISRFGASHGSSSTQEPGLSPNGQNHNDGPGATVDPSSGANSQGKAATNAAQNVGPVFGGLKKAAARQAEEFANRLRKRARHLRRWPQRGITCFRLYEKDIPEIPLVVDRYEDSVHMAEFARPHDRTRAEHADWLDLMQRTAADVLDVDRSNVHMKFRDRQRGASQYNRTADNQERIVVQEGGLKFFVNLTDYLDTGLFLDHRITRGKVRDESDGKKFVNLFAYTGSFTVYAAAGGATETVTVDSSPTYLAWASDNVRLNKLAGSQHRFVKSDAMRYLRDLHPDVQFDLAVVDPPTFSNKKDLEYDWDVQRDHGELLKRLTSHMSPDGVIYFSTNFRRFKLDEPLLTDLGMSIREISRQTVPEDFRNRRIHRCWRMVLPS